MVTPLLADITGAPPEVDLPISYQCVPLYLNVIASLAAAWKFTPPCNNIGAKPAPAPELLVNNGAAININVISLPDCQSVVAIVFIVTLPVIAIKLPLLGNVI